MNRSPPTIGAGIAARRGKHVRPFNSTLRELALDSACTILLSGTTAVHRLQSIDRLVWSLADLLWW